MSEYKRLTITNLNADKITLNTYRGIGKSIYTRLQELEDKIESGQLVELPCVAMVEQGIADGKFKPTKEAQQFNGRYAVVYFDKSKFKKPLIDICWSRECKYDYYQAEARLKELKGEE